MAPAYSFASRRARTIGCVALIVLTFRKNNEIKFFRVLDRVQDTNEIGIEMGAR